MTAAPAADGSDWRLLLPLGAFFVLFFAAPLLVLFLVSLSDGLALNTFSPAHYAKFPGEVAFELLNEPKDAATTVVLNPIYAEAIRVIRETNPRRVIFVGPGKWN